MKHFYAACVLSAVTLSASERVNLSVDAVYLKFYSSSDGLRSSCSKSLPDTIRQDVHNITYEPSWGLGAQISYKANYIDLVSRLSGFFFKNSSPLRSHVYPGMGFQNDYQISGPFNAEFITIETTSSDSYRGSLPNQLLQIPQAASGVALDGSSHIAFNSLDLTIAPEFNFKKSLILRPVFGLGGLISNFRTDLNLFIQQGSNPVPGSDDLLVLQPYQTYLKFHAVGPECGLDFNVKLTSALSLENAASFRWLIGHKKTNNYSAFTYDSSGDVINNSGSLSYSRTVVQSDIVFSSKLVACVPLNRQRQSFGLSLGYKLEVLPKFFASFYRVNTPPTDGSDFMYQALTAGAFYKF